MSEQERPPLVKADNQAKPVMEPGEVSAREDQATDTLPPEDRVSLERSAGEGYVRTQIEASTVPTQHVTGAGELLTADGTLITPVTVELLVVPPIWGGTLTLPDSCAPLETPGRYRLRLEDGRTSELTIKAQASCVYTVEGSGPLDSAA